MSPVENAIEQHPIFHDWYLVGDYVFEHDSRNRPYIVRREEKCYHCPTMRYTRINVRDWTRIGSRYYVYVRGVRIIRMTKNEFLKRDFLSTTDLPNAVVDEIIKKSIEPDDEPLVPSANTTRPYFTGE